MVRVEKVKLHHGGKRWYVSYYLISLEGKRKRIREYAYINKEKDLTKRMELLKTLQHTILMRLFSDEVEPLKPLLSIYKVPVGLTKQMKIRDAYDELNTKKKVRLMAEFLVEYSYDAKSTFYNKLNNVRQSFSPSEKKWLSAKLSELLNIQYLKLTFEQEDENKAKAVL